MVTLEHGCAGGDALIYGESLTAPGGIDRIRSIIGVCQQFDVLYNELTGREHLLIYGSIKVNTFAVPKAPPPPTSSNTSDHFSQVYHCSLAKQGSEEVCVNSGRAFRGRRWQRRRTGSWRRSS